MRPCTQSTNASSATTRACPLPAAAFHAALAALEEEHAVTLRWLAVDDEGMKTDHRSETDFERQTVAALRGRKDTCEQFDDEVYRRAAASTLKNQCLKCHFPQRRSTADRKAGLIVTSKWMARRTDEPSP